jgi:ribosomal protein L37E
MSGKYRKEHNCLNCGFHVEEHYCSRCGQPNLELKENFWQFISHSVAHYFHFDNKFFQTLRPLITNPGKVTLDYLAGKRARYINPISMYIFVSIVYFLVVYAPKKKERSENHVNTETKATNAQVITGIDSMAAPLNKAGLDGQQIASITKKAVQKGLSRSNYRKLNFKQQDSVLTTLKNQYQITQADSLADQIKGFEKIHIARNDSTYTAYLARQQKLPEAERDTFFERFMTKRKIGIGEKSEQIQEQLDHNRPKQYFLFMPLMALFIMLNFRKNHIKYLDHLIFTIHGMTAFFIVSTFVQPLKKLLFANSQTISGIIEIALIAWICWYLFKSLKVFYQRKTSTTIWRMLWIIILYSITLGITEDIMRNIIFFIAT